MRPENNAAGRALTSAPPLNSVLGSIFNEARRAPGLLEEVNGRISSLEERLNDILKSDGTAGRVDGPRPTSDSPFADQLRQQADNLQRVIDRLDVLLTRIDL